ncbi:ATP-binding cassette domain-containing protein [Micromonospora citrea]|uniref:ATP-binding cassette domain-containing protein n=1 Tax=Micromonospora citrea TaxID=47855 RepID=UPI003C4301C0
MRLEDVRLRYHRRGPWVLRAARVGIGPGEVAVVLGRNGVGKSTLLQLCAGVLRPARGRVVDRPGQVGWVPERFPAEQPFTVERYLTAMGRAAGLGLGLWAHLLALPPAVALGALASRALTRTAGYGVAVLALGAVGALALGLRGSVVPWLAPPVMATARTLAGSPTVGTGLLLSAWALAWASAALAGYAWRRRARP